MRLLADAGISPKTVDYLRRKGHDAVHVREIGMQREADRVLVEKAQSDDRILLTFDLDFGEIFALGVFARPSVVIFRLSDECAKADEMLIKARRVTEISGQLKCRQLAQTEASALLGFSQQKLSNLRRGRFRCVYENEKTR